MVQGMFSANVTFLRNVTLPKNEGIVTLPKNAKNELKTIFGNITFPPVISHSLNQIREFDITIYTFMRLCDIT